MSALDRDAVHAAVDRVCRDDLSDYYGDVRQRMHEALEGCLRPAPAPAPAPAQTIDRDALVYRLQIEFGSRLAHDPFDPDRFYGQAADAVLALLQPSDCVILTRDEAATAVYALRHVGDGTAWRTDEHRALAARLEAAQ